MYTITHDETGTIYGARFSAESANALADDFRRTFPDQTFTVQTQGAPAMTADTYTPDTADDLATLDGVLAEMRSHIEQARTILLGLMQETPAPLTSPTFAALQKASDHLWFSLTAYEPAPEDVKYITAAPNYTPEAQKIQLDNAEDWYNQHANDPAYQYSDDERAEMLAEIAELRAATT